MIDPFTTIAAIFGFLKYAFRFFRSIKDWFMRHHNHNYLMAKDYLKTVRNYFKYRYVGTYCLEDFESRTFSIYPHGESVGIALIFDKKFLQQGLKLQKIQPLALLGGPDGKC